MQLSSDKPFVEYEEANLEEDYVLVLQQLINILKQAEQIEEPSSGKWHCVAHDVARKVITHLLTLLYVTRGTKLPDLDLEGQGISFFDYSSANVVVRSALEAYLTFHNIFIKPDNDERELLLKVWDLGGLQTRMKVTVSSQEGKEKMKSIKDEANILKKIIKADEYFTKLNKDEKKKAVKGEWRLGKGWRDLAVSSGFSEKLFFGAYGMLSSEAHSGKTSINKLQYILSAKSQKTELKLPLKYGLIVMGQLVFNYVKLYPESSFKMDSEKVAIIALSWKEIGEKLFRE